MTREAQASTPARVVNIHIYNIPLQKQFNIPSIICFLIYSFSYVKRKSSISKSELGSRSVNQVLTNNELLYTLHIPYNPPKTRRFGKNVESSIVLMERDDRGCLNKSRLSHNPDRTHSVSVETIGDWIIFVYMNSDWVMSHSGSSSFHFSFRIKHSKTGIHVLKFINTEIAKK